MTVSFLVALFFEFYYEGLESWQKMLIGVSITTVCWVVATLLTKPTNEKTLRDFCRLANPGGPGWKKIYDKAKTDGDPIESDEKEVNLPAGILCTFLGCAAVYGALFATGYWMYGNTLFATILTVVACVSSALLFTLRKKVMEG